MASTIGDGVVGVSGSVNGPDAIQAAPRSKIVDDNVWQWIHDIAAASLVQPTANLGTGFIEYNPPDFLIESHKAALAEVEGNQYAPVPGLDKLKQTISDVYSPLYQRRLDPDTEICVTSGAQEGLLSSFMAFIEPGDEVILLEPVFTMYVYQIKMAGGTVRYVPLRPPPSALDGPVSGNAWTFDRQELEGAITPRTKMICLNNPHNPLGKVFTRGELTAIGNLCVAHNLVLVSDEVYEHLVFAAPAHCAEPVMHTRVATLSPAIGARTLTAVSLGKLFNATGWRAGFVIGPAQLMRPVIGTHLVLAYSSSSSAQHACAAGLRRAAATDWWTKNADDVASRVGRVCAVLDDIGLSYVAPAGAYFIFVNIDRIQPPADYAYPPIVHENGTRDWMVCYFMVRQFGLTSIPGSVFYGPENSALGASYVRLGACKSDAGLRLAAERLRLLRPHVMRGADS